VELMLAKKLKLDFFGSHEIHPPIFAVDQIVRAGPFLVYCMKEVQKASLWRMVA
jgi:hypothetical protein